MKAFSKKALGYTVLALSVAFLVAMNSLVHAHVVKAATPTTWAPITISAFEAQCVMPNSSTIIDFNIYNSGDKTMTVVGIPWGVATIGESAQSYKGPSTLVNSTASGLIKTAKVPAWHWVVKVPAKKWTTVSLDVLNTGAYYTPSPDWDPTWGPKPISRFYTGATFYVRNTTQTIDVSSHPAHCKQLGGK